MTKIPLLTRKNLLESTILPIIKISSVTLVSAHIDLNRCKTYYARAIMAQVCETNL